MPINRTIWIQDRTKKQKNKIKNHLHRNIIIAIFETSKR
jgi:hypothetical protein